MHIERLVDMANRIGDFFQAMPDHEEAMDGIVVHLHKFWDPRMRRQLLAHVGEHEGAGLSPLVLEALRRRGGDLA